MLDLRKAFDLVDHSLLLQKLHLYGLDDQALSWFTSYLKDREFQVKIENKLSSLASIKSGVPQGSILCCEAGSQLALLIVIGMRGFCGILIDCWRLAG
jgi:hypothetical protein